MQPETKPLPSRLRKYFWRAFLCGLLLFVVLLVLFVVNGTRLGYGETPYLGITSHPPASSFEERSPRIVKLMAFNLAKCFAHQGGVRFEDRAKVADRVRQMGELIRGENPDVVFLSETLLECTPCPVNQVAELAEVSGMHTWAFGENYNFGLPFFRVIGGNAILSRWPLEPIANLSLAGRRPFYVTKNNRRALWCALSLGNQQVLLASVHNDSFDLANNLRQTRQILDFGEGHATILAGDFNARPGEASIDAINQSGRFTGVVDGPATYPATEPDQQIDFIFVPATWELIEHRAIATELSDHRPVVSTFHVNP